MIDQGREHHFSLLAQTVHPIEALAEGVLVGLEIALDRLENHADGRV